MKRPRVSVIVPVYNTAEYLDEALDSIKHQTLKDIEIIAVDDGSTDESAEVLKRWSSRIEMIVLSKKNAGQAAARNDGLDIASGDYIYFMDSDDWIEPDTLARCVEECDKSNLDFAFFDAVSFNDDGTPVGNEATWFVYHRGEYYPHTMTGPVLMSDMLENGRYRCSVCMSLFRRTFLTKRSIRFKEGIIHEDELFSAQAYFWAERAKGIDKAFYHRRIHGDSTMTKVFSERNVDGYLTVAKEVSKIGKNPGCEEAKVKLISSYMVALMDNGWNLPFKTKRRIAKAIIYKYPYTFKFNSFLKFVIKKGLS